jgi:Glycosyl hydrolases family 31
MGRFGGLGAHRYPIGFVGDTHVKWEVLRYETYFMPTSSNVMFQWTHDIGGFEGPSPPEFFTRHVQFGTFSPQLRTHSSKRSPARAIWNYPQPYFATMKRFYRLRARLVPYIATMQRKAYSEGLPVVRPLYYSFPWAEPHVYTDQALHQYSFGDAMWLAPIAAAAPAALNFSAVKKLLRKTPDGSTIPASYCNVTGVGVTPWTFWAPPGKWIEWFSWEKFESPSEAADSQWTQYAEQARDLKQKVTAVEDDQDVRLSSGKGAFFSRHYAIGEVPLFSRPGTIIPMRTLPNNGGGVVGISAQVPTALTIMVFGGVEFPPYDATTGKGGIVATQAEIYDDDGVTVNYDGGSNDDHGGHFKKTRLLCQWKKGLGSMVVSLGDDGEMTTVEGADQEMTSDSVDCRVERALGVGFPEFPDKRTYTFRFVSVLPPSKVIINHSDLAINDQEAMPDANGDNAEWQKGVYSWAYDGTTSSVWVHVGVRMPTDQVTSVQLQWAPGIDMSDPVVTNVGMARKVSRAIACKEEIDALYGAIFPSDVESLLNVTAAASRMRAAPNAIDAFFVRDTLKAVPQYLQAALESMQQWRIPAEHKLKMPQLRCINSVKDALVGFVPLKEDDPRVIKATQKPTFRYTAGEHLTVPDPQLEGLSPLASDDGSF